LKASPSSFKLKLSKKISGVWKSFLDFKDQVPQNWVSYTYIKNGFLILIIPILYFLGNKYNISLLFLVPTIISIIIFIIFDSKRNSVAWEYPENYMVSEKIEKVVERLFYIFILFTLISALFLGRLDIPYLKEIFNVFLYLMLGTSLAHVVNIEPGFLEIVENKVKSLFKRTIQFQFHVPLILRVRARLWIVFKALTQNNKLLKKNLPLFRESITGYNKFLRSEFDFVIAKPEKFYKYIKLAVLTRNKTMVSNIVKGLHLFIKQLEKEEEEPIEVIKLLKRMIGETVSEKDISNEINIESRLLRKWFSTNLDLIKAIIALITLIDLLFQLLHR